MTDLATVAGVAFGISVTIFNAGIAYHNMKTRGVPRTKFEELQKEVTVIRAAITGINGHGGIIGEIRDLEAEIKSIRSRMDTLSNQQMR